MLEGPLLGGQTLDFSFRFKMCSHFDQNDCYTLKQFSLCRFLLKTIDLRLLDELMNIRVSAMPDVCQCLALRVVCTTN